MSMKTNLLFSGCITLLTLFIQLAMLSAMGKLGPELLAYYNIIEIAFAAVPALILFGGDQYFQFKINQYSTDKEKIEFYFSYLFLSFVLFVFFIFLCFSYFFLFEIGSYLEVTAFVLVSVSSFLIYLSSYLYRSNLKIIHGSLVERSFYLINGLFLLLLCLLYPNVVSKDVVSLLAIAISTLVSLFFLRSVFILRKRLMISRVEIIRLCILLFKDVKGRYFWFTGILIFVYERVDQLFIVSVFNYKLLGYYFACYKLSFLPRLFTNIVYSVVYPYLARMLQVSKVEAVRLHDLSFYLTVGIAVVLSLPLIFFPDKILEFVFDASFTEYSGLLKVIVISMIISCVNQINYSMINANGQGGVIFFNAITSVLAQFIFILFFYESYGLLAIAGARLLVGFVGVVIYIYAVKLKNVKVSKILTILGIYSLMLV